MHRILIFLSLATGVAWHSALADNESVYREAVASTARAETARARDAYRRPEAVLAFSGVGPGDVVVEIAPGAGYYTAILSRVVGDDGEIIAVDPERIFEAFPRARDGFAEYAKSDPRANVEYSVQYLDEIELPAQVDQLWMVLYYHDTLWTGEDRAAMNSRFFNALKPGGRYLVIDHHGLAGVGAEVGKTLHRMDRNVALDEITSAGFELVAESDVLGDDTDPRDDSVFDAGRRGKTDRFVLLFKKPL